MSTHGYISVEDVGDRRSAYLLYAYSSGHAKQQLEDLADMPFVLFRRACHYAIAQIRNPEVDRRFMEGPWFMLVPMLDLVKRDGVEPDLKRLREYRAYNSVTDYFKSAHPIECDADSLAHWMVGCHFGRWHVCWKKSQMPYERDGPDHVVHVENGAYEIRPHRAYAKEHFAAWAEEVVAGLEPLQANVPPDERVVVDGGVVRVPFMDITMRLAHHYLANKTWEKEEADAKARQEAQAAGAQGVVPNGQ